MWICSHSHCIYQLEFGNVSFGGEGKTGVPLRGRTRTNSKLNSLKMPSQGVEPGRHWWEVSAFITTISIPLHALCLTWFRPCSSREQVVLLRNLDGVGCWTCEESSLVWVPWDQRFREGINETNAVVNRFGDVGWDGFAQGICGPQNTHRKLLVRT